jgi:H+/Cl- antiporter ClcA
MSYPHSRVEAEHAAGMQSLGDFTASKRLVIISGIAIVVGSVSAFLALALLRLIGFFTNLFFFGRLSTSSASPKDNHLGVFVVAVPVAGALIIGLMAKFGSERIRGHGIPEAIEAILIGGSRVQPRIALLKPLSSAISIGSGGPFGAEGPIIMTGGAFGSLIAQCFNLTSSERKTLLVSGAAAGMSATFASPVAAVLLAVELLLFEWKPRSLVPVALASATAAILRRYLLGLGPIFPTPPHEAFIGPLGLAACVAAGVLAGGLSALLTLSIYAVEDAFQRLPIHWMWWPAIGGLAIGIGGLIFPEALGVGYDVIETLLRGDATTGLILGVLLVKSSIWAISLGSGTSGGVLAPLLMMGGALGGLEAHIFPDRGPGFWPVIGMAAILGGTMRAPLTGIVFTLELTHDINLLLPLLCATVVAHGFTVLTMKRSILTEKVSRRGFHLSREYAVDPLEVLFAREVMRTDVVALRTDADLRSLTEPLQIRGQYSPLGQGLYPVVDGEERFAGIVTRGDLHRLIQSRGGIDFEGTFFDIVISSPVVAFPDEPLRVVVERMAETGFTRLPVVARHDPHRLEGIVSLSDLLRARKRSLAEERTRERVLQLRFPTWPGERRPLSTAAAVGEAERRSRGG